MTSERDQQPGTYLPWGKLYSDFVKESRAADIAFATRRVRERIVEIHKEVQHDLGIETGGTDGGGEEGSELPNS